MANRRKLQELLQLSQIMQQFQQPQQDAQRADNAQLQVALQILGLQQRAKDTADDRVFREQQLQETSRSHKAAEAADASAVASRKEAGDAQNRITIARQYIDMGEPRVAAYMLAGRTVDEAVSAAQKEKTQPQIDAAKQTFAGLKSNPKAAAEFRATLPPDIAASLDEGVGMEPAAAPAAPQAETKFPGVVPQIGKIADSAGSALQGFSQLPGNILSMQNPVNALLMGEDEEERQRQGRVQLLNKGEGFLNQLIFGGQPQKMPDSPEMQAMKREAMQRQLQKLTSQ